MLSLFNKILHRIHRDAVRQVISHDKSDVLSYRGWQHSECQDAYLKGFDPRNVDVPQKVICHCYWYGNVGRKQAFSIKSFLATQDRRRAELWLWLDEASGYHDHTRNVWLQPLLKYIRVLPYDPRKNIADSVFRKDIWVFDEPTRLDFRADGFRTWVLHEYGGLYFDLDVMFLRDFTPLFLGSEFVYAWPSQPYANNAVMYLRKGSYVNDCIAKKVMWRKTTRPWVLFRYNDKRLKHLHVYPACLFDPLWQAVDDNDTASLPLHSFAEFFAGRLGITGREMRCEEWFPGAYAYHRHNCWNERELDGSYFVIFENQLNQAIAALA